MSTRLVILGLLQDHPMYGYEIKSTIEEHMSGWTSIAFGSIYFALNKLSQEGLVEKIATEQEGSRPSRTIYEITDNGKTEFMLLLRKQWSHVEREFYNFDIALFFQEYLSSTEIMEMLKQKIGSMELLLNSVEEHRTETLGNPDIPPITASIFNHSLLHMKAELEWLKSLKKRFPGG